MTLPYKYSENIDLYVPGRIPLSDAQRQTATSREILHRLRKQAGLILADEVGMGKTFVALAVAASVALSDEKKRQVVVMVPPSLKEKWPRDYQLFLERCLPPHIAEKLKSARAERAVEFLKLLDDPPERRKSIIFLTHGAMYRALNDGWVKLALIYRALYHRKNVRDLRRALCRNMDKLLQMGWVDRRDPDVWHALLTNDPRSWLDILHKHGIDPENDDNPDTDDDPVPKAVRKILWKLDTDDIFEALKLVPWRQSRNFEANLTHARRELNKQLRNIWKECIKSLRLRLPLLILDEAHHLKNAWTQLSSLFQVPHAEGDSEEILGGPFGGVFERMLFLTATPFQLGHHELCSVLERFDGIAWRGRNAPPSGRETYLRNIRELRTRLDAAQEAAVRLDTAWGLLRNEDMVINGHHHRDIENWWNNIQSGNSATPVAQTALTRFDQAKEKMQSAEKVLKKWIVRHLRSKKLQFQDEIVERRRRLVGKAIVVEAEDPEMPGIEIEGEALLPFLLAARATACTPESRPVFAEGLASSYEAFLHTRTQREKAGKSDSTSLPTDKDDNIPEPCGIDEVGRWYLDQLQAALPIDNSEASRSHPKIAATVNRTLDLWRSGEKVLVFCHYIATGRALRQHISEAIGQEIIRMGASKLECTETEVLQEFDRIGD